MSIFAKKKRYFAQLQSNLVILLIFFTKIAITQPKKSKFKLCCVYSHLLISGHLLGRLSLSQKSLNYTQRQGKVQNQQKFANFLHCKKLKLHFLKNFPRFDLTDFFCDFLHMRPFIFHWPIAWNRTGVIGGMHGWRE